MVTEPPMIRPRHAERTPDVPRLLAALRRHGVRYVLTGSVAALFHGVELDEPGDLDIAPALDRDNLGRLADVLTEIEAGIGGAGGHWETLPDGERTWMATDVTEDERVAIIGSWFPDPDDLASLDALFLTRHGNVDVVPEIAGGYDRLMERAVLTQAHGHDLWVAHIDDLLATLTVPRRAKDGARVRQLRAIQRRRAGPAPREAGRAGTQTVRS